MNKKALEENLIKRLLEKDESALQELMSKYQTKVYNTALNIVKNSDDAQEITQDVFFTVFNKLNSFKGNSSLYTWIYRITVNFAFMKIRSRRKEIHIPISEATRNDDEEERFFSAILPDKNKFADELVVQKEIMEEVLQSVEELPDKYKKVFLLRDIDLYTNHEVGRILNISVAAVKSRIHRARLILREKISHYQN